MGKSRIPRYKRPKKYHPSPLPTLFVQPNKTPQRFSHRLYEVSWIAAMCWGGVSFGIGFVATSLCAIKVNQAGGDVMGWVGVGLLISGVAWAYFTEAWWFGLSYEHFAEISHKEVVFFGLFGRERKVFLREHCQFMYHMVDKDIPYLFVKPKNAWFWRPVSLALCTHREAFIEDLGAMTVFDLTMQRNQQIKKWIKEVVSGCLKK